MSFEINLREWLTNSANIEPDVDVDRDDDLIDRSIRAFEYLRTFDKLNHVRVKEAHREFMDGRQPDIAGEYRDKSVYAGEERMTDPEEIVKKMNIFFMDNKAPKNGIDALEKHVNFEKIHPFADGNGRIGRIIYLWHCDKLNIKPIDFSRGNREAYYDLF